MSHYCFAWKSSLLFSSLLVLVVCCSDFCSRLLRIRRTSVSRTGILCFFRLALLESCLANSSRDLLRVASSRQHLLSSFLLLLRRHANTASSFLLLVNSERCDPHDILRRMLKASKIQSLTLEVFLSVIHGIYFLLSLFRNYELLLVLLNHVCHSCVILTHT